ncbi:MAG TPA: sigma-70 family RNA polymerase sigma factor [Polyangiaceae bacterium]|jgi:RNA polymerase sigma-70 factor (ECF subfamily)|nr:sigma-70 family RNA polymerase sigma factor [Polyangiaceae bacterium]
MTFDELYDRHFDFVWTSLRRLGVPPADLPDVSQEVFVVVHRRLPEFEERAKATTWLFRICMHAARDRARRAHVRREIADGTTTEAAVIEADDAERLLERRDDVALFERVLDGMSHDHRVVFVAFELAEQTGEELAEALELPLGTVYSRLRLAREAFRRGVSRVVAQQALSPLRREGAP